MERTLKKEVTRRYKKMLKAFNDKGENQGKTNCYVCNQCHQTTKVYERDNGMTMHGIECPYCKGEAMSTDYEDVAPKVNATFEYVRPTLQEVLDEVEKNHIMTANYYLSGGLKRIEKKDAEVS